MKWSAAVGTLVAMLLVACALVPSGRASELGVCDKLRLWPISDHISGSLPGDPSAEVVLTRARLSNVADLATKYCVVRGAYPEALTALGAFSDSLAGSDCGVRRDSYLDAWDRPVYYGISNGTPVIVSAGVDGAFSTADDVALPSGGEPAKGDLGAPHDCSAE
jgi:hypothetical protein